MSGSGQVTQRPARAWHVSELQGFGSVSSGAEGWGVGRQEGAGDLLGMAGSAHRSWVVNSPVLTLGKVGHHRVPPTERRET